MLSKKWTIYKPGSVFAEANACHLSYAAYPPGQRRISIGRVALNPRYIWPYNPKGLSPSAITDKRCELLPHIFTLTVHCCAAVIFCDPFCRCSLLHTAHPFKWFGTLCCPDFPHLLPDATSRLSEAKIRD